MSKKRITDVLKAGKILVSDGAWGTFLHNKGLPLGECPELWNVLRFDDIVDIAGCYIGAGADMIETNSFGGTCFKLESFGLSERAAEINEAASRASRLAAGDDKWVIASVGPTGKMMVMEDVTEDELYSAFKEQVIALEKGGADAVCIETMSDIEEAELAVKAARDNTSLEIICTFTFERTVRGEYRTMMGVSPTDAAAIDADIIGTNCGNGIERMIEIVKEMRKAAPEKPILVHANAGLPKNIDGKTVFPESPEDMAGLVPELIAAGVNIIGGCCGTSPEHIKAIKTAVGSLGL